jgi:hypothetical protein
MKSNATGRVGFVLFLVLLGFVFLALELANPPRVVPASAAASEFSAARAMKDLRVVARRPHSAGTAEHDSVLSYLLQRLRDLGLKPQVQNNIGSRTAGDDFILAGQAKNILAFLPGTNPSKTVLVMAHYDSQPNTPGATDDGAGVVAILETIRALKTNPPLKNDVLFLITDLEEDGLLGAKAFVDYHPEILKNLGLVLNYEARGNAGASVTFEVNPENGWVVREFAKAAPFPLANSLAYEIYRLLPNDTDFSVFRPFKTTGLNSAGVDGFSYYHSKADTPENTDQRLLQHHGSNMLALVRHFGAIAITETKAPDIIFFNPFGSWLIYYPATLDFPLQLFTALLFGLLFFIGLRGARFTIVQVLLGVAAFLGSTALAVGLGWLAQQALIAGYPQYGNFDAHNYYNSSAYAAAFASLGVLCFGLVYSFVFTPKNREGLLMGALLLLTALVFALGYFLKTGAYLIYYPLIVVLLANMVLWLTRIDPEQRPWRYALLQGLGLLPAIGLWVPLIYLFYILFSLDLPFGDLGLTCLLLGLAIPSMWLLHQRHRRLLPLLGIAATVVSLLVGHFTSGHSERYPLKSSLFYLQNQNTGKSIWVSTQADLDDWNRQFFKNGKKAPLTEFYPTAMRPVWKNPAPKSDIPVVAVTIEKDSLSAKGERWLRVHIQPKHPVNTLRVYLPNGASLWSMNGVKYQLKPLALVINFCAVPPEGLTLDLSSSIPGPLEISIMEHSVGLPEAFHVQCPKGYIPTANMDGFSTQTKKMVKL